jgi:hypothetical protein
MWIRVQEHGNLPKFTNKPGFLPSKKPFFTFVRYFFDLSPVPTLNVSTFIFHVKIQLFATLKYDKGPHPDPHGYPHWFGSLDP